MQAFDATRIGNPDLFRDMIPRAVLRRRHTCYGDSLLNSLPKTSIQAVQYSGHNFCDIKDFMTQRAKHCVVGVPRYDEDCLTVNATGSQMRLYVGEMLVHGEDFYIEDAEALARLWRSTQYCSSTRKEAKEHDDTMAEGIENLTSCIHWAGYHTNRKPRVLIKVHTYYALLLRGLCIFLGCEIVSKKNNVKPDVIVTCFSRTDKWQERMLCNLPGSMFSQPGSVPMLVNIIVPARSVDNDIKQFTHDIGLKAA